MRSPIVKFTITVLSLLILFACILVLSIGIYQIDNFERIFPGITVWGVDVSGMNRIEATERLSKHTGFLQEETIILRDDRRTWTFTPGQLGMSVKLDDAIDSAFTIGHSGLLWDDMLEQWNSFYFGQHISPVILFDMLMAEELLKGISRSINELPRDASFSVIGNILTVDEGQKGRTLDITKSMEKIIEPLVDLVPADIGLDVNEFTPLQVDADKQRIIGQMIIEAPLVISVEYPTEIDGPPWIVDQASLIDMLVFRRDMDVDDSQYTIAIDKGRMVEFLQYAGKQLRIEPQNAMFGFDDEIGQLELIKPAIVGRELDVDTTLVNVIESLESGEHNVFFQFNVIEPDLGDDTTIDNLGISGMVAQATTFFKGSGESRQQNIRAGSEMMNGVMVPPGLEFSFNENLGDISLDTGFAEAWIIFGGRTIQGVGGGICQVSTTAFRAAFYGGYPIVERNPHAYRVGYYEQGLNSPGPGLDATIFSPVADLRFVNDRDAWLLIETELDEDNQSLSFRFYSAHDPRIVTVSEPKVEDIVEAKESIYEFNPDLESGEIKQVDWENEGAKITVERIVELNGEIVSEDTIRTTYQPWGSVYQFGLDVELPEGAVVRESNENE
jgi:vancomycin resistance protein YoaR